MTLRALPLLLLALPTWVSAAPPQRLTPRIWETAAELSDACDTGLTRAAQIRAAMLEESASLSLEQAARRFHDMLIELDLVAPMAGLLANTHPDKAMREAGEACEQKVQAFVSKIELDHRLYSLLAGDVEGIKDPLLRRFVAHQLRDYRRSGVDKDEATREKLKALRAKMVKVGQDFSRNIREDRRYIEVTPEDLVGLPEDFLKAHPPKDGKIKLSTAYPEFYPVVRYAQKEAVRKAITLKFLQRAYPVNVEIFKELLTLRHEYATLLGYADWAAYNSEDKMAKDKATISSFIEQITAITRPRMEAERAELLARKQQDDPKATALELWDRFYYTNKLKAERFGVDARALRAYFEYSAVLKGVLAANERLFGVEFREIKAPVWHEEVKVYDLYKGGQHHGRFYLDMHPREDKYGHAAMFTIYQGVTDRVLPTGALVTNFPRPGEQMEHQQVETFFHEFGHLMHHLLGGPHPYTTMSGITCEWDFVEAPSQLLEEWAWDPAVLAGFTAHAETKAPLSAELVAKMRQADEFGKGMHVMRQMFYAALSFGYHSRDPKGMDVIKLAEEIEAQYSPYPHADGTYIFASFGHLEGYSSMYYTYMWSLMLAKDLFTRFQAEGMDNPEVAAEYRKLILEPGGTVDAHEMVKSFLGREYRFDAFKAWLEN